MFFCLFMCSESQVLSLLSFFIKNGNVTVYEWKNGIPPPVSTDPVSKMNFRATLKICKKFKLDWKLIQQHKNMYMYWKIL